MDSFTLVRKLGLVVCCLSLISATNLLHGQAQIRGVSSSGGQNSIGKVISFLEDGTLLDTEAEFFNSVEGETPEAPLFEGSDGSLYGTTSSGGENGGGTLYRIDENENFEILHHFDPSSDGFDSRTQLVEVGPNTFIGVCSAGAENESGSIFRYSSAGFEVLHSFVSNTQGSNPQGKLQFISSENAIYGTCGNGGINASGSIFRYSLSGNLNIIHHLTGNEGGSSPQTGLTAGSDGLLYGSTRFGGAYNQGAIFRIDPTDNSYQILYDLNNVTADGRQPIGSLVESSPGVFLGTCSQGGSSNSGSIFRITSEGVFTKILDFLSPVTGGLTKSGVQEGPDGRFYGLTEFGGAEGFGTFYSIAEDGDFIKLLDFDYVENGANPVANPTLLSNGDLVFPTQSGGTNDYGAIIRYNENSIEKMHDFSLPLIGASANGIQTIGNIFIGTTLSGGVSNNGTIFKLGLDGALTKVHDFTEENGQNPNSNLFVADDETLYGTCRFGGNSGAGTVYSIDLEGNFNLIHEFENQSSGQFPTSSPILHSNGTIYGTASFGGSFDDGVLYAISHEGEFSVLANFFGFFEGGAPGALVEGDNGMIYGVCAEGGSFNQGTFFGFDPETALLMVLHEFSGADGGSPRTNLNFDGSSSMIYGTTSSGGAFSGGTIFSYSLTDGFEVAHEFNPASDGSNCAEGLTRDENGDYYGFCSQGGGSNNGTCFKYGSEGFEVLYEFSGLDAPGLSGTPALFFPDCFGDEDCISSEPCSVGRCNFGLCEEVPINPTFSSLQIGNCEVGFDVFSMTVLLTMDISPGGTINIAGQDFTLTDGITSYQFVLEGLPSTGAPIDFTYSFAETGCTGSTGVLGTAPVPCPPIEITFTVDVGDLEVGPDGIFLGGSFQGWTPSELPMNNMGDGIWEVTTSVGSGNYQFNFFNGSSIFDGEYVIGECASNGKRALIVEEESQTLNFCWGICGENCSLGILGFNRPPVIRLSLYPNPLNSGQFLSVELPDNFNGSEFQVIGMSGSTIKQGIVSNDLFRISTAEFRPGVYTLIVRQQRGGAIATGKFIVN